MTTEGYISAIVVGAAIGIPLGRGLAILLHVLWGRVCGKRF